MSFRVAYFLFLFAFVALGQYDPLVRKYYADLTVSWNSLPNLLNVYPNYFTPTGFFCTATGTPCLVSPLTIGAGLKSFCSNVTTLNYYLGPLQISGNVGSYSYTKVFAWKNGCALIINGFSAFMVDPTSLMLTQVNDYVDSNTVGMNYAACVNYVPH